MLLADLFADRYSMIEPEFEGNAVDLWFDDNLIATIVEEDDAIVIYEHDGDDDSEWMGDFDDNDETVPKANIEAALEWVDEIVASRCPGNWVGEWWELN